MSGAEARLSQRPAARRGRPTGGRTSADRASSRVVTRLSLVGTRKSVLPPRRTSFALATRALDARTRRARASPAVPNARPLGRALALDGGELGLDEADLVAEVAHEVEEAAVVAELRAVAVVRAL